MTRSLRSKVERDSKRAPSEMPPAYPVRHGSFGLNSGRIDAKMPSSRIPRLVLSSFQGMGSGKVVGMLCLWEAVPKGHSVELNRRFL